MATLNRLIRRYTSCEVAVAATAPASVVRALDVTMSRLATTEDVECAVVLTVTQREDRWQITAGSDRVISLPAETPPPAVARAVAAAIAEEVAGLTSLALLQAVIVEHGGRGLALLGDDWPSRVAIATHLSTREWRIVTSRYAFVDRKTLRIVPFPELLYATSEIIQLLPRQYRRALESSPWYSTRQSLSFYGIDPQRATGRPEWADSATLCAALIVTGAPHDFTPSLGVTRIGEPSAHLPFDIPPASDVNIASLTVGPIVATTNLVERWAGLYFAVA
jgi:hypothetical protein